MRHPRPKPEKGETENLSEAVFIRIAPSDKRALDDLCARLPFATPSQVARFALRLGISAIEEDPSVLLAPAPKKGARRG